jgi:MFS family permease
MAGSPDHADQGPSAELRATTVLYAQTVLFSLTLGMIMMLTPLYVLELGYSVAWLGVIISAQGVFQLGLRLFGGVLSDRVGERWVIAANFLALLSAALLLALFEEFWLLILAQLLTGASRSIYWAASQSYASRINEAKASSIIGRFFGIGAAGGIVGTFAGGLLAGTVGYTVGFLMTTGMGAVSLLTVVVQPSLPRKAAKSIRAILAPVPAMFVRRTSQLPAIISFGTSLVVALVGSLMSAYLVQEGYSEMGVGFLRAVHGGGAVVAGFAYGILISKLGARWLYAFVMLGSGGFLALAVIASGAFWPMLLLMFALGVAFNAGRVLYASMTAELSAPEERGVAMAVFGLYWAAAQLVGPVTFGLLAGLIGVAESLLVAGAIIMVPGVLTPWLFSFFTPEPATAVPTEVPERGS